MNEKIAVIGGGQMGSQIAALAAMAGYKTNIYDENKENLEYRYKFVEENIKNLIDKKIYSEDKLDYYKENLELDYSLEDVIVGKSFVIEAVVEKFDVKLEIFNKIYDRYTSDEAADGYENYDPQGFMNFVKGNFIYNFVQSGNYSFIVKAKFYWEYGDDLLNSNDISFCLIIRFLILSNLSLLFIKLFFSYLFRIQN